MVKLQERNGQFFVTIPKLIVKKKGWQKGQELLPTFDHDGNLVLSEI